MTLSLPKLLNGGWLERQQSSILSAAAIITVANVISALSGLIIKRALIFRFFDTPSGQRAVEAFWFAFQIPDFLFQLIVLGALSAAFIPIFSTYRKKNEAQAFRMSSIMMNVLLLLFAGVAVLIFIFAEPITQLRSGAAFQPDQIAIVTNLTRLMLLAQFFFAISNFLTGILQSYQRFIIPALAPIMYNLGILIGIVFLTPMYGIYGAGLGVIIGAAIHMGIQFPLVAKLGFRYYPSLNVNFPGIKEFFGLMPPRVMALGASEFRKLFLGFFATSIGGLSFMVMQLALTLMIIPIRFFGVPIGQASLPFLSESADDKKRERFRSLLIQSLHQIAFLAVPASILLLILRIPAVRLIFGTFNFPWATTVITARVVAILSLSILFQALAQLITRSFYALKDTRTPFTIAVIDLVIYLLLGAAFVFFTPWPLLGLAVTTSLTALIEFSLLLVFLHRRVGGLLSRDFFIPQLKILVSGFFMAVFLYLPFKILDELVFDTSRTIELIALTLSTSTIGMLVYIYFAMLFEVRELQLLARLWQHFTPWKKTLAETTEVLVESGTDSPDVT